MRARLLRRLLDRLSEHSGQDCFTILIGFGKSSAKRRNKEQVCETNLDLSALMGESPGSLKHTGFASSFKTSFKELFWLIKATWRLATSCSKLITEQRVKTSTERKDFLIIAKVDSSLGTRSL